MACLACGGGCLDRLWGTWAAKHWQRRCPRWRRQRWWSVVEWRRQRWWNLVVRRRGTWGNERHRFVDGKRKRGKHTMKAISLAGLAGLALLLSVADCGNDQPTCVSFNCDYGRSAESCLQATAYCEQNINDHLDGCDWKTTSGACSSQGFPYQCRDNLYTHSSSDCSY